MINNLDVVVKSFNRQEIIDRLVVSWNSRYPNISLNIVDDSTISMDFSEKIYSTHKVLKTPKCDMGISFGRNFGASHCTKDYVLFLDDDFIITERTNLEDMLELFTLDNEIGVVTGPMNDFNGNIPYHGGTLKIENNICYKICNKDKFDCFKSIRYRYCDLGPNFMIVKREVFSEVKWDDKLKVGEHVDFFLKLKNSKWKMVFTPDSSIKHIQHFVPEYNKFRFGRHQHYKEMMWKKYNLKQEVHILDGKPTDYWLKPDISIKFDEYGRILPYNKRLYNYVLLRPLEDTISQENKYAAIIIAVGNRMIDENNQWSTPKFKPGDLVFFEVSSVESRLNDDKNNDIYLIEQDKLARG